MAHTFDTNLRFTGSNSPLTQSYTCGSGATVLVLGIVTGGSVVRAGGAPTYNGVSLTQADSTRYYASSPETSCELWYLLAPPTGASYTISVPNTGAKSLYVQASSYKAASGATSVLDVAGGSTGLSALPSVSVTTTSDGDVIVAVAGTGNDNVPFYQSGTSLNRTDDGTFSDSNQYKLQPEAGLWTIYWLCDSSDDWCICAVAFKEASSVQTVEVSALSLTSTLKSPVVAILGNQTVGITAQALSLGLQTPSIDIDNSQSVLPSALNLSLSLKAPTVIATKNPTVSISAFSLSVSVINPSVAIQGNQTILPSTQSLSLSQKAPTVVIINNPTVLVPKFDLKATLKAPTCLVKDAVISWALGQVQRITLRTDTLVEFNPPTSARFLKLIINNKGLYSVNWPENVHIDSAVAFNDIGNDLYNAEVANWKMNDNAASSVVLESHGNYNGTYKNKDGEIATNTGASVGKTGGALSFDGRDAYGGSEEHIDCGTPFQSLFQSSFSISMWVLSTRRAIGASTFIFGVSTSGEENCVWVTAGTTGSYTAQYTSNNNKARWFNGDIIFPAGQATEWVNLIIVHDHTVRGLYGLQMFVNSELGTDPPADMFRGNTTDVDSSEYESTVNPYIGAENLGVSGQTNEWCGLVDDVRIFNKALTLSEVEYLFNSGVSSQISSVLFDYDGTDYWGIIE